MAEIQYTIATENPVIHAQQIAYSLTAKKMGEPQTEAEVDLFCQRVGLRTRMLVEPLHDLDDGGEWVIEEDD